jgi:hypothetical protein
LRADHALRRAVRLLSPNPKVREVTSGGWRAGSEAAMLPLWQFWGAAPAPDGPAPPQPCYGLPALPGGARAGVAEAAWRGARVAGRGAPGAFEWAAAGARRRAAAGALALEDAAGLFLRDVALRPEPGEEDGEDEQEEGEEQAAGGGGGGGGSGGGGGGRRARPKPEPGARRRRLRSQLLVAAADALPAVGWHPGFEPGRALVACAASGSAPRGDGCLPAFQIAPVIAKISADLLTGRATGPAAAAVPGAAREEREAGAKRAQWAQQWKAPGGGGGSSSSGGAAAADSGHGSGEAAGSSGSSGGGGEDGAASSSLAAALWAARPAVALRGAPAAGPGRAPLDTLRELAALQRRAAPGREELERAADEASDRGEGRSARGRAARV